MKIEDLFAKFRKDKIHFKVTELPENKGKPIHKDLRKKTNWIFKKMIE